MLRKDVTRLQWLDFSFISNCYTFENSMETKLNNKKKYLQSKSYCNWGLWNHCTKTNFWCNRWKCNLGPYMWLGADSFQLILSRLSLYPPLYLSVCLECTVTQICHVRRGILWGTDGPLEIIFIRVTLTILSHISRVCEAGPHRMTIPLTCLHTVILCSVSVYILFDKDTNKMSYDS